jgi:hypothetical protein
VVGTRDGIFRREEVNNVLPDWRAVTVDEFLEAIGTPCYAFVSVITRFSAGEYVRAKRPEGLKSGIWA